MKTEYVFQSMTAGAGLVPQVGCGNTCILATSGIHLSFSEESTEAEVDTDVTTPAQAPAVATIPEPTAPPANVATALE